MRKFLVLLAIMAWSAIAAPSVQSSQFTTFSGNSVSAAIPAGAVGDGLVAIVALPCNTASGLSGLVSGWTVLLNLNSICGTVSLKRISDGTETSVDIPLTASVSGVALVVRVSGVSSLNAIQSGPTSPLLPGGPNASRMNYFPSADTLWLTFANALSTPVLAPSGYSNTLSGSNGNTLMLAEKVSTASSEDAGAWVLATSVLPWRAQTIGIR